MSPASFRVCCLVVMAPALTKADRQADCLPVVLSESFCGSKTLDRLNSLARGSDIRLKCAFFTEYLQNKKKPFMHRACWRTQRNGPGFLGKHRSPSDSSKSLLTNGRVRTLRDPKHKTWQSTNATTAYADKIRLKYTMSKHTSNFKNMGLAKANTSLGLQSLKKVKHFKENQNSRPNVMEDSMNFSDSTDSTVPVGTLVSDVAVLATNSDSDASPVDCEEVSHITNNGRTSQDSSNIVSDTVNEKPVSESVLENNSQHDQSVDENVNETTDTLNPSVTLTGLLNSPVEITNSVDNTSEPCSLQVTDAVTSDSEITEVQNSPAPLDAEEISQYSGIEQPEDLPPSELDAIPLENVQSRVYKFLLPILSSKCSDDPPLLSLFPSLTCSELLSNALRQSDAFETKMMKCPVMPDVRCGLHQLRPVRREKGVCCLPSSQELESLELMSADRLKSVKSALSKSTLFLQKCLNAHSKKQISSLVDYYQRKYQVPCQRPAKHVNTKSGKELGELKAELLQSEDVKSMSTAALVSLVRKLESSGSQARILSPKVAVLSNSPNSCEDASPSFDPEDVEDIKHTSGVLISNLKSILKASDPYFTDSSEEEYDSETEEEDDDEEEKEEDVEIDATDTKNALWKYLAGRAALGSSSTWLVARIHELEYRAKDYVERQNDLIKAEGTVCLDAPVASQKSALSIAGSDNARLQTSVKQAAVKNFLLPLNGFLDRSDISHITKTSSKPFPEIEEPNRTDSDTEIEEFCSRTTPLNVSSFRKRKLAFIPGLHTTNSKLSRLSNINCNCNSQNELAPCILCTGQYNSIQSVDPHSMALRDRIAILDPYFHPVLSTEKDIPFCLHMENILKIDAKNRYVRPLSPEPVTENEVQQGPRPRISGFRSHRKLSRYARTLSAKYRNKRHRNTKHLGKHKYAFGNWRRYNKHLLRARSRFRRHTVASRGSSPDSPVHSPMSVFEDGYEKKRRDDSQFDIDDVILPCNSKSGRLVEIQYKEIAIPSWRSTEDGPSASDMCITEDAEEDISDSFLIKRHDMLQVEEKEKVKHNSLALNRRRRNRCDSRADSSGANTPDPNSSYGSESMFQTPSFSAMRGPLSPASPTSAGASDDSQPAFSNSSSSAVRSEKSKVVPRLESEDIRKNQKRLTEEKETTVACTLTPDYDEVPPYEIYEYPLSDEAYEELLADTDHNKEVLEIPSYNFNYPTSPVSSSSSTSTVEDEEEEEDVTDPEWTVVKPIKNSPEQTLVLKFAKR